MQEDLLVYYFPLVKAGYGSLKEVEQMTAREVLQAIYFMNFKADLNAAYLEQANDDS